MAYSYQGMQNRNRQSWWLMDDDVNQQIFADVDFLDRQQPHNRRRNYRSLRLYSDLQGFGGMYGIGGTSKQNIIDTVRSNNNDSRITLNVIRSVVDAATSRIGQNKARPFALTHEGDFVLQQRAKRLNKFIQGQFSASKTYPAGQEVLIDAAITGTGAIKIYEQDSKIVTERVWIDEFLIDEQQAVYGDPRDLFQVRNVAKSRLMEDYAELKEEIEAAGILRDPQADASALSPMATVVEAWHLPSYPGATDGRHVLCIGNAIFVDEPWHKSHFPVVFLRWTKRRLGFFGEGLSDNLKGIQFEVNLILRKIQSLMRLATSHVFIHRGSKVVKSHLSNEDWGVIEYVGQQPIFTTIQAISPEYFQHLDRLYSRAFEQSGVSELSATGRKPAGLNSGKSIIEYNEIQSERFALIGQAFEEFYMDVAKQQIELAKEIYKRDGKYAVVTQSGRKMEIVDWSEIDLEADQYMLQIYPTSFLPQTPAGKWEQVAQMIEVGFVSKDEASLLMDYPDLEAVTSLNNSPLSYANMIIEQMLGKGKYVAPDPHSDLQLNVKTMTYALLKAQTDEVPEDRLDLLRQYIADATAVLAEAAAQSMEMQQQVPPGAPQGGPPPGGPAPDMAQLAGIPSEAQQLGAIPQ